MVTTSAAALLLLLLCVRVDGNSTSWNGIVFLFKNFTVQFILIKINF